MTDYTANAIGSHPFPVRVTFGDERDLAYVADGSGQPRGPGVQALTPDTERALGRMPGMNRPALHAAVARLGVDVAFALNVACQGPADRYLGRLREVAAQRGLPDIPAGDRPVLEALKAAVDSAAAIGPQAIVRAAMDFLARPSGPGAAPYGRLVELVDRLLRNPAGNPRRARAVASVASVTEISRLELWWIKEGSATIVFKVGVGLAGGRPDVSFILNVAKDATGAAAEVREVHADFAAFFAMDPALVMEPLGQADVTVASWRGPTVLPVLAAEWFEGHELHVYEDGPQLHVWQDQHMGREHPLPTAVSDSIWRETVRMRARLTRRGPAGLLPVATQVNAGDYIFGRRGAEAWDVLLIWARRAPADVTPADFIVASALFAGVNIFGAEPGPTVWWDQPEPALAALREGLTGAGLRADEVATVFRAALDGVFARHAADPRGIEWLGLFATAGDASARQVFDRARAALAATAG